MQLRDRLIKEIAVQTAILPLMERRAKVLQELLEVNNYGPDETADYVDALADLAARRMLMAFIVGVLKECDE